MWKLWHSPLVLIGQSDVTHCKRQQKGKSDSGVNIASIIVLLLWKINGGKLVNEVCPPLLLYVAGASSPPD